MANDYKQDTGKVPLLAALQPFAPALYALARMMDDMQHKHRLAGSEDPFSQWAQLPQAKARMSQALVRHLVPEEEGATLWAVNTKDGNHLHATHGLFNLLGAITLHIQDNAPRCCGAPDADGPEAELHRAPIRGPAGADWRTAVRCLSMSQAYNRCELSADHSGPHMHAGRPWA